MKKLLYLLCIVLVISTLVYEYFGPTHSNRTSTILGFVAGVALLGFVAVYFNKSSVVKENA